MDSKLVRCNDSVRSLGLKEIQRAIQFTFSQRTQSETGQRQPLLQLLVASEAKMKLSLGQPSMYLLMWKSMILMSGYLGFRFLQSHFQLGDCEPGSAPSLRGHFILLLYKMGCDYEE